MHPVRVIKQMNEQLTNTLCFKRHAWTNLLAHIKVGLLELVNKIICSSTPKKGNERKWATASSHVSTIKHAQPFLLAVE